MSEPSKFWMSVFPYIQDQMRHEPSKFWIPVFSLITRPNAVGTLISPCSYCFIVAFYRFIVVYVNLETVLTVYINISF